MSLDVNVPQQPEMLLDVNVPKMSLDVNVHNN